MKIYFLTVKSFLTSLNYTVGHCICFFVTDYSTIPIFNPVTCLLPLLLCKPVYYLHKAGKYIICACEVIVLSRGHILNTIYNIVSPNSLILP